MESDDFLCRDEKGNLLLAVEPIEEDALAKDPHFTHCLAVVKVGDEHLLGWNNWRKRFELFGGCREEGETPRVCILREWREELGFQGGEIQYLGAMKLRLIADYFSHEARTESGGLYGITLPAAPIAALSAGIQDRAEIARLGFYSQVKGKEPIAEIDEKLLEFFP